MRLRWRKVSSLVLLEELDFAFPEKLIAQNPIEPRDACRLMVVDRRDGTLAHRIFRDLPELLMPGDLLVLNDSRVLAARVFARKPTGGKVELLFLEPLAGNNAAESSSGAASCCHSALGGDVWKVLARPSQRLREGLVLEVGGFHPVLRRGLGEGVWLLEMDRGVSALELMDQHGHTPLPPYIKGSRSTRDDYQTVYAREPGSAAAPTAGLHFTERLLADLRERGVETAHVTLHVGLDTFRPLSERHVEEHAIHTEIYSVSRREAVRIEQARRDRRRVIAIGTTAVRVLETIYRETTSPGPAAERSRDPGNRLSGATNVFITPGFRFQAVDALITNFHLPRTSLLALVMAFAGVENIHRAYAEAVRQEYRFFSFGDAMLITGDTKAAQPA